MFVHLTRLILVEVYELFYASHDTYTWCRICLKGGSDRLREGSGVECWIIPSLMLDVNRPVTARGQLTYPISQLSDEEKQK